MDLSTLSAATDVALGFGEPLREVVDLNFQSGADPEVPWRAHLYNAAFGHRLHRPGEQYPGPSVRPAADHPHLTGKLHYGRGDAVQFNSKVIRLWQRPGKTIPGRRPRFTAASAAVCPAAGPVAGSSTGGPDTSDRPAALRAEADEAEAKRLLTGAFIPTGLRRPTKRRASYFEE